MDLCFRAKILEDLVLTIMALTRLRLEHFSKNNLCLLMQTAFGLYYFTNKRVGQLLTSFMSKLNVFFPRAEGWPIVLVWC